eukprot:COSAG06_NODE_2995_length_5981_cov_5.857701_2_plen_125_part_00
MTVKLNAKRVPGGDGGRAVIKQINGGGHGGSCTSIGVEYVCAQRKATKRLDWYSDLIEEIAEPDSDSDSDRAADSDSELEDSDAVWLAIADALELCSQLGLALRLPVRLFGGTLSLLVLLLLLP